MRKKSNSISYAIKNYGLKSFLRNAFSITISDVAVVSFQKSGRTWLRLMYGKMLTDSYRKKHEIKKINLDTEYMTLFKPLQNVLFSHAGCTKNHNRLSFQKIFRRKKVVLLVRDPRAVMVSLFHDHTKRNHWYSGNNQSDFIRDKDWGLPKVIAFMNSWAKEYNRRNGNKMLLMKYEDLFVNTAEELKRFLLFLGIKTKNEIITDAVEYGSPSNMRKLELAKTFNDRRMLPGDVKDKQSYRTRKCKLGSFREELNKDDLDYITKEMKEKLNPLFGYS